MLLFRGELFAAGGGQFVITRLAIVLGNVPLGANPTLCLRTIERGIKRTLLNAQNLFRHLLYSIGNFESMPRSVLKRFQEQHVQPPVTSDSVILCKNFR